MLLTELKNEEKFAFLSLAHHIAHIDGEFDTEEKEIIHSYCLEMGIDNLVYDASKFDLDDVLKKITGEKSKKIVILELMILIHSDDKFHRFEHKIIEQIASFFTIQDKELSLYSQWGKAASASYTQARIFLQD